MNRSTSRHAPSTQALPSPAPRSTRRAGRWAAAAVLWALLAPSAQAQDLEAALAAIDALAAVNGRALACQEAAVGRRAKALMLAHAPKTARFGDRYEQQTQESFLAVTRQQQACPSAAVLNERLDAVARQLQAVLPAAKAAP